MINRPFYKSAGAPTAVGSLLGGIIGYATAKYILDAKRLEQQLIGAGVGALGGGSLGWLSEQKTVEEKEKVKEQEENTEKIEEAKEAVKDFVKANNALGRVISGSGAAVAGYTGLKTFEKGLNTVQQNSIAEALLNKPKGVRPPYYLPYGATKRVPLGTGSILIPDKFAKKVFKRSNLDYLYKNTPVTPKGGTRVTTVAPTIPSVEAVFGLPETSWKVKGLKAGAGIIPAIFGWVVTQKLLPQQEAPTVD